MHHSLFRRLLPFLRRDARAKLAWAGATGVLLIGLLALGIAALTRTDSQDAQRLRVTLGLESPHAVCGGLSGPTCLYDDTAVAEAERDAARDRELRLALLAELDMRIDRGLTDLDAFAHAKPWTWLHRGLRPRELSPLPIRSVDERMAALFAAQGKECKRQQAPRFDGIGWVHCASAIHEELALQRQELLEAQRVVARLQAREDGSSDAASGVNGSTAIAALLRVRDEHRRARAATDTLLGFMHEDLEHRRHARRAPPIVLSNAFARVLETSTTEELVALATAVRDPNAALWAGGFETPVQPLAASAVRYRSPVTAAQVRRLLGFGLFGLASLFLLVVGPAVTATSTARERESGTLPVLRMTGLSPGDLAWAMIAGSNVYAWAAGGALLLLALPLLLEAHAPEAVVASALLVVLGITTHIIALGLGFAASRRLPAWALGGAVATALLAGGIIGCLWLLAGIGHTGMLLGPLPLVFHAVSGGVHHGETGFGTAMFAYAIGVQALTAGLCLLSWRRRIEQSWMPVFRPAEGIILGALAVGCGAFATLDLSAAVFVTSYDQVNTIVAIATTFTLPIIVWALVSSLVRPARASVSASLAEVRRGFIRFQLLLVGLCAALAGAYATVINHSQLQAEPAQLMWLTLAHVVIIAETMAATLLLGARRSRDRHRVLILGSLITVAQLALIPSAYRLEREIVALGQSLLAGLQDVSAYWLVFLVLLWAAGLGLVLAALLQERDRKLAEEAAEASDDLDDEDSGGKPNRWLH